MSVRRLTQSSVRTYNPSSSFLALKPVSSLSWIESSGSIGTKPTGQISYGAGLFVAGSSSDTEALTKSIYTSPDGITWTDRASPSGYFHLANNAYGNGTFVLCSYYYNDAATSPDGITWTARSYTGYSNYGCWFLNGNFYRPVAYNTTLAYSSDGITWNTTNLSSSRTWQHMAYGNGVYVASCSDAAIVSTSSTGTGSWTERSLSAIHDGSLVFINGLFVIFHQGASRMATSPDGVTWTDRTAPMAGYWSNGAVGDGLAVITSQNGGLDGIVSTDGITWTVKTTVSGGSYQGVAYGKQSFVSIKYETNKVARLLR